MTPAGLIVCVACDKPRPAECYAVEPRRGGGTYRRKKCRYCRKAAEASRAWRQTEMGRLCSKRNRVRSKIRELQELEEIVTRQIERARGS